MPPRPPADRRATPLDVRFVDPLDRAGADGPDGPLGLDATGIAGAPTRAAAFAAHPDWTRALARHLVAPDARVARVWAAGTELARLPCAAPARGRSLRHPAHDHLSLADVDVAPDLPGATLLDAVDATIRAAAREAGPVPAWRAAAVPEDSALVRAVRARAGVADGPLDAGGWALRFARDTAGFELEGDAFPVPGKLRRNLRRLRVRLHDSAGAMTSVRITSMRERDPDAPPGAALEGETDDGTDDGADLEAAFERFVALEATGWKSGGAGAAGTAGATAGGRGTAIAHDRAALGFYRALLRPRAPGLAPTIVELELDGRTVAAQLALRTGTALHLLKIAYDESLAAASPGSLLLDSLIARAPGEGLTRVSLVTSPAWAARWHPVVRPAWHVVRYADTVQGRLVAAADRARAAAAHRYRRARAGRSSD